MKKKIFAAIVAGAMVVSTLVGCGQTEAPATNDTATDAVVEDTTATDEVVEDETPAPVEETIDESASIDFEDGAFAFVGNDNASVGGTKPATVSVADCNGSKALKVEPSAGKSNIAFQMDALLGENADKVATIDATITIESADGTFRAASGVMTTAVEGSTVDNAAWSIYLENKNPKRFSLPVSVSFADGAYFTIGLTDDLQCTETGTPTVYYIDNVAFKDASGNLLAVDTAAEFVVAESGDDSSNLFAVSGAVEIEGFAKKADAWAQDGVVLTEEQVAMLVPGSVIEFEFASESGNLWAVVPWAQAGWMRVGQSGTDDPAYINNSKNKCQITYEQIAALCGDDVSTWGTEDGLMIQAESDSAWEVYSVKIGMASQQMVVAGATEIEGFDKKADAWAQDGVVLTEEQIAMLVPGSVIEFTFASESGNLWAVVPWAQAGWMRVGQAGTDDPAVCAGGKCYVTYEQIAAICGDDVSTWGSADGLMIQAESDSAWEVYSVSIGTAAELPAVKGLTEIEGFAKKADAWAQDGVVLTEEQVAMLVPGSVIEFTYVSESGNLWAVVPWATAGWMRVGQAGTDDPAVCANGVCYVTYEQIAALCGDDVSTWGTADGLMIQAESDSAWEVYSVSIGRQ